ncbi:hypothetical protein VTK26DRAFT_7875 [Humicola hyalothermophila]
MQGRETTSNDKQVNNGDNAPSSGEQTGHYLSEKERMNLGGRPIEKLNPLLREVDPSNMAVVVFGVCSGKGLDTPWCDKGVRQEIPLYGWMDVGSRLSCCAKSNSQYPGCRDGSPASRSTFFGFAKLHARTPPLTSNAASGRATGTLVVRPSFPHLEQFG